MSFAIAAAVYPVIFIGELPDKTMFASLVLASRGRPVAVWLGAAGAFLVHVVIAATVGVALFRILPDRVVSALVAVMFLVGAVFAYREGDKDESELVAHEAATHRRVITTAFVVIFVAEWGDLTQVLIANLSARYHEPLSVAVGAAAALWSVAAIAALSGQWLVRVLPGLLLRRITGTACAVFAAVALVGAIRG